MNTRTRNVVIGAALAVVVLFVVAVALGGGEGGDDTTGDDGQAVAQYQAVDLSGGALPPFESTEDDPAVGQAAPTVVGHSFDGSPARIAAGDGTPKLLVFLAHWCPHCQAEVPVLREWMNAGGAEGVEVVGISTSATDTRPNWPPSEWLEDEEWPAPVLVDDQESSAGTAYGLTSFPFFVLVDGDGTVVVRGVGELTPDQLTDLVDQVR